MARANSAVWGDLPALGPFAVVNPQGQGRMLTRASWGDPGQIDDLARMPRILSAALPWLRIDRRRVYAVGGSMGGQESLLLLARHPRLLAGVVAFDAPTDLARRYRDFRLLARGVLLRNLLRTEVGGTPSQVPALYAARSPLHFARQLAFADVPIELWWSTVDRVVVDQTAESGLLYRQIKRLNQRAPVEQVIGRWAHTAELNARRELPDALLALGLVPLEKLSDPLLASSGISRLSRVASRTPCALRGPRAHGSYGWPLQPFDRQHPIRGTFGDPRTVYRLDSFDGAAHTGSFTFHNGIDIVAAPDTPVYPVVSGIIDLSRPFTVRVRGSQGRSFEYWHIRPLVRLGQHVIAGETMLGRVLPAAGHVHLSEFAARRVVNPLAPGHLTPYRDTTPPAVLAIRFADAAGKALRPLALQGQVQITVAAYDTPPKSLPAPWQNAHLAPALLRWQITTLTGRPVFPARTAVDFRSKLPPERDFWQIYAPDSYQNSPVIGLHDFLGTPGSYLYTLTPKPLDTNKLRPGPYLLTITARDTCGNSGLLRRRIRILPATSLSAPPHAHHERTEAAPALARASQPVYSPHPTSKRLWSAPGKY